MDLRGTEEGEDGGCGRNEGRCAAGSNNKEVVVGGGSRHVTAPLKYRPLEMELTGECKISIGQDDPVK